MSNFEVGALVGLCAIVFLLAKQHYTSEKVQKEVFELRSELQNTLDRQSVHLSYMVLYASRASDLTEDEKSAIDLNMEIELQCVGLDAEESYSPKWCFGL